MMGEIEDSCFFLIQYAEFNNLDMKKILNATTRDGITLFFQASCYSESVAKYLLEFDVNVNSIDNFFQTQNFRVGFKLLFENNVFSFLPYNKK